MKTNTIEKIFPKKIREIKGIKTQFFKEIRDNEYKKGLERFRRLIERAPFIYLSTHEGPDADGLGSQLALYLGLKSLNIPVKIVNPGPVPEKYKFLEIKDKCFESSSHNDTKSRSGYPVIDWKDLSGSALVILDTNNFERTGFIYKETQKNIARVFIIDHHTCSQNIINSNLVYAKCSSTGELVFQVLKYLGCKITMPMARALYSAILFDTGSFRYPNTSFLTHKIVSELLKYNINTVEMHESIFQQYRPEIIYLLGRVLKNIRMELENKLAIINISRKDLKKSKVKTEDTDNIVNIPLKYKGVFSSALFREEPNNRIKVSLRSIGNINVAAVVRPFNGGGHINAAGAIISTTKEKEKIIDLLKKEILKSTPPFPPLK